MTYFSGFDSAIENKALNCSNETTAATATKIMMIDSIICLPAWFAHAITPLMICQ